MKVSPDGNFQQTSNSNKCQYYHQSNPEPYSFEFLFFLILFYIRLVLIYLFADMPNLFTANWLHIIKNEWVILNLFHYFFVLLFRQVRRSLKFASLGVAIPFLCSLIEVDSLTVIFREILLNLLLDPFCLRLHCCSPVDLWVDFGIDVDRNLFCKYIIQFPPVISNILLL